MTNIGKAFEKAFVKCVPDYVGVLRIPDSAQSFARSTNLRFSTKMPFDYILWNPKTYTLYILELKTVKDKSISFERTKEDHGEIHFHQIDGIKKMNNIGNCVCGFIIEFRGLFKTIFLSIDNFQKLIDSIPKKSFNFDDLDKNGIDYIVIEQHLLKKYSRYNIEDFLNKTSVRISLGEDNEI